MYKDQGLQEVERTRIISIVRGVEESKIVPLAKALLKGGITVMEVTLNTPGALAMIAKLQKEVGDEMFIGAGTVLNVNDAQRAIEAGASFLVTPHTDVEVIHYCVGADVPIFPGAMTPTEVYTAWKAGATAIKVFPANQFGPTYFKDLKAPFDQIPLLAVGGVTKDNLKAYLEVGCHGVGIASTLANVEHIRNNNFDWVEKQARTLITEVQKVNDL